MDGCIKHILSPGTGKLIMNIVPLFPKLRTNVN